MFNESERVEERPASAPTQSRGGARGVTGAVILIGLGVLLLLDNLGVISVAWWSLLRFWPVILILVGLDLILGRRSTVGSLGVAIIGLLIMFGIVVYAGTEMGSSNPALVSGELAEPLDAEALEVNIHMGLAETQVTALRSGSDNAYEVQYTTDENLPITDDYSVSGGTGYLTVSQEGEDDDFTGPESGGEMEIALSPDVPIDLIVDAGIGSVTLDLTGLNIRSLTVHAGIGEVSIILPETGDFEVTVDAGIGEVNITVPESMEALVLYDSGLSGLDLDKDRFEEVNEDEWQTADYDRADNRVVLNVHAGIGSVEID